MSEVIMKAGIRVERVGDSYRLLVGAHTWAHSIRTSGFPLLAVMPDGNLIRIGSTAKQPTSYSVPSGALAILRIYRTNSGYVKFYVYTLPDLTTYILSAWDNYEMSQLPAQLRQILRPYIDEWVYGRVDE